MPTQAAISKELILEIFHDANDDGRAFLENIGEHILEAFTGIRLIGEIERPEGIQTYEALRRCLGCFVKGSTALTEFLEDGCKKTRAVFGLYLVWAGIFEYGDESGHELWPPVLDGFGLHTQDQAAIKGCRKLFYLCLEENQLEGFPALDSGRRYVDRILLHGPIPDIHMDRFIREVIRPVLEHSMGHYENGDSIVRRFRQRRTPLPKPIQNFIEHGHPVNADIIDRLLRMAREWENDEPGRWQLWGLPKYMVDAFRNFGHHPQESLSRKSKTVLSGSRPYVKFDWETNNSPVLVFPPQIHPARSQFVLRYAPMDRQSDVQEPLEPGGTPIEGQYQADHLEHPVGPARDGWAIDISCDGASQRLPIPYKLPAATSRGDELPLFFFNAHSGKLLNAPGMDKLPEELIVVYPQGATLELVGGGFLNRI